MSANRLDGLDALRGIAALMVVLFHVEIIFDLNLGMSRQYLAVQFFFILSGFVMARTYEHRFSVDLRPAVFLKRRFARFFPLMACGASIGVLVRWGQMDALTTAAAFALGLVFIPLPGPLPFPLNNPAWSIFSELAANVTHSAVLYRLKVRWLFALSIAAAAILLIYHGGFRGYPWFGLAQIGATYPLGVMLWRLNGDTPRLKWWVAAPALVGWPIVCHISGFGTWSDAIFVYFICPVALLSGLKAPPIGAAASFLGSISFPLYAVHEPVIKLAKQLSLPPGFAIFAAMAIAVAASGQFRTLGSLRAIRRNQALHRS
jgi:peptidoglycan/LPS O-acetylase OafA/YrhL